jgi:hypothetical protein
MLFKRFVRICRKYGFAFDLFGGTDGVYLTLRPYGTFRTIEFCSSFCDYNDLFKRAIRAMKTY